MLFSEKKSRVLRRKIAWVFPVGIAVFAALGMAVGTALSASAAPAGGGSEKRALEGVSLDRTPVGGKTMAEIEAIAAKKIEEASAAQLILTGLEDGQEIAVTAAELGLSWRNPQVAAEAVAFGHGENIISRYKDRKDLENGVKDLPLQLKLDEGKVVSFLQSHSAQIDRAAVEGTMGRVGGALTYVPGKEGHTLDVEASAKTIARTIADNWNRREIRIPLDIIVETPRGSEEELSSITDLLGYYTTNFQSSGSARSANIDNGCRLVSGHIVYPGEVFSVLEHLVPFTEENGYALAGSYLGTKVVDSLGGGICQVSTTLYNAVIRSELLVVERSNHSMIVSYVAPSMDAAIAESTGMDFKFRNSTDYPIYIEGSTADKLITFQIYGKETRDPARKVIFESEVLETIPSEGVEVETDATEEVGYVAMTAGHTGYKAQLWKIITVNDEVQSKEVFNKSNYKPGPAVITVGTAGNVTQELAEAMNTKDLDTIRAAATRAASGMDATEMLTQAAGEAAQEAFADAIAQGIDQETAKAIAQEAANEVVDQAAQGIPYTTE